MTYTSCYCEENVYLLCKQFKALFDDNKLQKELTVKSQQDQQIFKLTHEAFIAFVTNK